jgi:hypothetical protein
VLAGAGLGRTLQSTSPHFLTVPYAVAESDLIACVPAGLARRFQKSCRSGRASCPSPCRHSTCAWLGMNAPVMTRRSNGSAS